MARNLNGESDRTPPTSPNSDSYGALRYRTLQPPKQRSHAIAPPQLPKQRTACSSATLTHPHPYKTFDKN
ncbi:MULTISPECIES: hypothetical protein [Aphanizomenonaceae]|uniref:hypothetical protein n=1 Tax=Aphanizomenonaceae TaxID=1892259 RepID=UPI001268EF26|nr:MULTISPECIES: hypothetical protein [Aphanizomenonaceae]MBE9256556.1 hypothetical protein [Dolichospermum sp. LEGE 00246]MDK2462417.1 hypothetical protein [Aphanizomenon sp. PH219]